MCKVSIIITAHNYAKFLPQSLESALGQSYDDFEVILVNDGSTDNTDEVIARYDCEPKLKVLELNGLGLAAACNKGIGLAMGEYVVRLDADDWLDENLLLVEANYLDRNPEIDLVFCDYHTVDIHGEIISQVKRAKVNDEIELLDRPCLAAGAMYRKHRYDSIGGYNESLRYQEDYDFWIKFIEKFQVRNVSVPLMYYRQHGKSMSTNWDKRMETRRQVKHKFVSDHREQLDSLITVVIPVGGDKLGHENLAFLPFNGRSLLSECIDKASDLDFVDKVVVLADNPDTMTRVEEYGVDYVYLRSRTEINPSVSIESTLFNLLKQLYSDHNYQPNFLVILHPHSPFIKSSHIQEAIDSILLYKTDSVVGVVEDLSYHWKVGRTGLTSVGYPKRVVRQEKDLIYKEAGGLYAIRVEQFLATHDLLGKKIGHIELSSKESFRINTDFDYEMALAFANSKRS